MRKDLQWWRQFLVPWNRCKMVDGTEEVIPDYQSTSDAAGFGGAIVRYNAHMGVHAATHQRADNMEYAKSRELRRARKRRSHRAVAGEGDAGHGIEV